jgi:predicted nucleic acid-binding protein
LVVLDTSALFAALDRGQQHHRSVLDALRPHVGSLIVPVAILAEISHFIERDLGQTAVSALARDIERGAYELDCGLERSSIAITTCPLALPTLRSLRAPSAERRLSPHSTFDISAPLRVKARSRFFHSIPRERGTARSSCTKLML